MCTQPVQKDWLFYYIYFMKDARKLIVVMFALTICAIMVAIISSWIYYGSAKPESVNILGHLIDTMLGAIIAYLMLKPEKNEG